MPKSNNYKTWADYHPEVAKNFQQPLLAWPCDQIQTDLFHCHQPVVVKGPENELFSHGNAPDGKAAVWHSTDGGRSWAVLCTAAMMPPPVPKDMRSSTGDQGIGVTSKGTLLVTFRQFYHDHKGSCDQADPSCHVKSWIIRSTDRGKTWHHTGMLDPAPYQNIGGAKARFHQMRDGRMLYPVNASSWSRPGKPLPKDERSERALLFESRDDGQSWHRLSSLGEHSDESDLLELPNGRILATTRYQRKKKSTDPADLITPYWLMADHPRDTCGECKEGPTAVGGHSVYKQSAILHSDDGGKTWSAPTVVTGWVQQTAGIVRLSGGTIAMPFGHKDEGNGQRFILSYDEGQSWSNAIFELNKFGMYAHSVILDDDTIVTVTETPRWYKPVKLHVLRWKVPPRCVVEEQGFFVPKNAN